MVMAESTMLPIGTAAPDFSLPEPKSGQVKTLSDVAGPNGVLVCFICNHCPFVRHVAPQLGDLGTALAAKGIGMVGIASNDVSSYPEDGPTHIASMARGLWHSFPYLYDETQGVAKAYRASCTPDYYLFDKDLNLYYRGQLDRSRPGNGVRPDGSAITAAADRLLANEPMSESDMRPSIGCSIKWKWDNAPSY